MRAVVTGCAGFIGSHLAEALLKQGHSIVGVDDLSAGKTENMKSFVGDFEFVRKSVCDDIGCNIQDADIVFHNAASKKNICLENPHKDLDVNAWGTLNLLQNCIKYGVKKFVHASTGSVYGEPVMFPQTEDHPLNPCSYYGVSKLSGERYVAMFNKVYGLNTTILRYFHVFGDRQDSSDKGGVIAVFLNKILKNEPITIFGTGEQERSFTYVSDIVRANLFVGTGVFNVASGLRVTINQLVDILREVTGRDIVVQKVDRLMGDIDKFDVSNTKIKSLGFEFQTDLRKNINDMWSRLQSQR